MYESILGALLTIIPLVGIYALAADFTSTNLLLFCLGVLLWIIANHSLIGKGK